MFKIVQNQEKNFEQHKNFMQKQWTCKEEMNEPDFPVSPLSSSLLNNLKDSHGQSKEYPSSFNNQYQINIRVSKTDNINDKMGNMHSNNSQEKFSPDNIRCANSKLQLSSKDTPIINNTNQQQMHSLQVDSQLNSNQQETNSVMQQLAEVLNRIKLKLVAHNFLERMASRRWKKLKDYHFNLIKDSTFNSNFHIDNKNIKTLGDRQQTEKLSHYFRKNECKSKTKEILSSIVNAIPLLHPLSIQKLIWDCIQITLILLYFFLIPINISCNMQFKHLVGQTWIHVMCVVILILDIPMGFITGFFEHGFIVMGRGEIAKHYLIGGLKGDVLSVIALIFHTSSLEYFDNSKDYDDQDRQWFNGLLLFFFIRARNFQEIFKRIEVRFKLTKTITNYIQLLYLLFTVIFLSHIFSCIWIYIGKKELSVNQWSWMDKRQIANEKWFVQYLHAYYFSVVTMVTVGYGDITPASQGELFLSIIHILIACGVFGYNVNELGEIFRELGKKRKQSQKNMAIINTYMEKKNISSQLQYQVRQYLEYFWEESNQQDAEQERTIIDQLSNSLKENLLLEANRIVLKESQIFKGRFSDKLIAKTVPLIKEYRCTPEEIICREGQDDDDNAIYFIEKGSVQVFVEQKRHNRRTNEKHLITLGTFYQGQSFGEIGFFTGSTRSASVRANDFTTLLKIRRSDFLVLLKEFPKDYEIFCMIKDKLIFSQDYQQLGIKCISCQSKNHLVKDCFLIHQVPPHIQVLKKYIYNPGQPQRQIIQRRQPKQQQKKMKVSQLFKYMLDAAERIQNKYRDSLLSIQNDPDDMDSLDEDSSLEESQELQSIISNETLNEQQKMDNIQRVDQVKGQQQQESAQQQQNEPKINSAEDLSESKLSFLRQSLKKVQFDNNNKPSSKDLNVIEENYEESYSPMIPKSKQQSEVYSGGGGQAKPCLRNWLVHKTYDNKQDNQISMNNIIQIKGESMTSGQQAFQNRLQQQDYQQQILPSIDYKKEYQQQPSIRRRSVQQQQTNSNRRKSLGAAFQQMFGVNINPIIKNQENKEKASTSLTSQNQFISQNSKQNVNRRTTGFNNNNNQHTLTILIDFEVLKSFENYMPSYNVDNVIAQIKKLRQLKLHRISQCTRHKYSKLISIQMDDSSKKIIQYQQQQQMATQQLYSKKSLIQRNSIQQLYSAGKISCPYSIQNEDKESQKKKGLSMNF